MRSEQYSRSILDEFHSALGLLILQVFTACGHPDAGATVSGVRLAGKLAGHSVYGLQVTSMVSPVIR